MINDWSLMNKLIWLRGSPISGGGAWTTISGAIVEFITQRAHKLKSCVVSLSPQQDLHGQDAPYPAGGGKNKFNPADIRNGKSIYGNDSIGSAPTLYNSAASKVYVNASYLEAGQTYTISYRNVGAIASENSRTGYLCDANGLIVEKLDVTWIAGANSVPIAPTTSGWLWATFDNSTTDIQLELGSTATSFAPYSNICPISGWTGCEVNVTGHNVWDEEWELGYIGSNGNKMPASTCIRSKNYIPVCPNTAYYYKAPNTITIHYYDADKVHISATNSGTPVRTTPENAAFVLFYVPDAYGTTYHNDISINYPSTDTEYHAYNGNSYSVTFGETVYGGYDDVVSGQVKDDRGIVVYSDSSGFVSHYSGRWYHDGLPDGEDHSKRTEAISNQAKYDDAQNTYGAYFAFGSSGVYINKLTADETIEEFSARLTANPFQICYFLSTPTDISTTPTPITALKGYNAMWSDGDTIEVTVQGTPVELSTQQALNMLLGGAYRNNQTADDVSDDEALDIILGGEQR